MQVVQGLYIVVSGIKINFYQNKTSVLVVLDLSAAVHTVDHEILLNR